jgi:hypothetical protein
VFSSSNTKMSSEWTEKLKKFDNYPKTIDEYKTKTILGGIFSLISICMMIYLFMNELNDLMQTVSHF